MKENDQAEGPPSGKILINMLRYVIISSLHLKILARGNILFDLSSSSLLYTKF